jgi:hypothetical protein
LQEKIETSMKQIKAKEDSKKENEDKLEKHCWSF